MNIKPLHDNVFVRRDEKVEKTKSGLLLAGSAKEKSNRGVVVAVGPGRILENGQLVPMSIKVGDLVSFANHVGSKTIKDGDDELLIMTENDIYGIIHTNDSKVKPKAKK